MDDRKKRTKAGDEQINKLLNHKFQSEEGNEYGETKFGGYGGYMQNKHLKLQNQAQEIIRQERQDKKEESLEKSEIFKGCVIYINGYTGPKYSVEQLQRLIILHGGIYVQHMYTKTSVTHVIATTLTSRKKEQLAEYKVVVPEWIDKCLEAGKLVPWQDYRTVPEMLPRGQTKLINTFQKKDVDQEIEPEHHESLSKDQPLERKGRAPPRIVDPDFISNFYQNSRLHHLSMWKAAIRQRYLVKAVSAIDTKVVKPESSLHTQDQKVIMHIDFDCFFAAASLLKRKDVSKDQPFCVASGLHDKSDIASCNYAAREYGIHNGMSVARAKSLCPHIKIQSGYDYEEYEKASSHMYETLLEIGADLVYPVSVDEALLDVTELISSMVNKCSESSQFSDSTQKDNEIEGHVISLANTLRSKIKQKTGLDTSVGIGPNVMLARVALVQAKPAGVYYISWNGRNDFLLGESSHSKNATYDEKKSRVVKLKDLPGVGRNIVSRLSDSPLHIRDFQQLARRIQQENKKHGETTTPFFQKQLVQVFGPKMGLKLWEYGQGIDDTDLKELIASALERKSIGVEISWGVRADSQADVTIFIHNMCKELGDRMTGGGISLVSGVKIDNSSNQEDQIRYVGSNVTVKIYKARKDANPNFSKFMGHGQCDIFSRSKHIPLHIGYTRDASIIEQVVLEIWKNADCEPTMLRGLGIQMTKLKLEKEFITKSRVNAGIFQFINTKNEELDSKHDNKEETTPEPIEIENELTTPVKQEIDWETYYQLPSTIRQVVKEEYHITSTPGPSNLHANKGDETIRDAETSKFSPKYSRAISESPTKGKRKSIGLPPRASSVSPKKLKPFLGQEELDFAKNTNFSKPLLLRNDAITTGKIKGKKISKRMAKLMNEGGQYTLTQKYFPPLVKPEENNNNCNQKNGAGSSSNNKDNILEHPSMWDPETLAELPTEIVKELEQIKRRRIDNWKKSKNKTKNRVSHNNNNSNQYGNGINIELEYSKWKFKVPVLDEINIVGPNGEETIKLKDIQDIYPVIRQWILDTTVNLYSANSFTETNNNKMDQKGEKDDDKEKKEEEVKNNFVTSSFSSNRSDEKEKTQEDTKRIVQMISKEKNDKDNNNDDNSFALTSKQELFEYFKDDISVEEEEEEDEQDKDKDKDLQTEPDTDTENENKYNDLITSTPISSSQKQEPQQLKNQTTDIFTEFENWSFESSELIDIGLQPLPSSLSRSKSKSLSDNITKTKSTIINKESSSLSFSNSTITGSSNNSSSSQQHQQDLQEKKNNNNNKLSTKYMVYGPHPADTKLFDQYLEALCKDVIYWPNAVKLLKWLIHELESISQKFNDNFIEKNENENDDSCVPSPKNSFVAADAATTARFDLDNYHQTKKNIYNNNNDSSSSSSSFSTKTTTENIFHEWIKYKNRLIQSVKSSIKNIHDINIEI